jgi:hypothetical protein
MTKNAVTRPNDAMATVVVPKLAMLEMVRDQDSCKGTVVSRASIGRATGIYIR